MIGIIITLAFKVLYFPYDNKNSLHFSGYTMFAGYIGMTVGAIYLYNLNYRAIKRDEIEMRSAKMAIYPMLLAERDREFLKQIRRNREAEVELMRDVPGWEVTVYFHLLI